MISTFKRFYNSIILFSIKNKLNIDYFLSAISISVLILLFIPTTFWLIFANIYLVFLNGFYSHILKSNRYIQIMIVFWLLSLMLYALTLFIAFDEIYIDTIGFAIRRFIFLLIFIITLTNVRDFPAVQIFQADYAIFDEGPSNKGAFLTFVRKHHILIIILSYISYALATSVFVTNPLISTFFGILTLVFAALYLVQSTVYFIAFWKNPLDKPYSSFSKKSQKKKTDLRRTPRRTMFRDKPYLSFSKKSQKKKTDPRRTPRRTMFSGTAIRKAAVTCLECGKGVGTLMIAGETLYKLSAGGLNTMSPPRQWVLNNMFPDDRTKLWTESKAAYALHNRAMGNPHNDIYQMQEMWNETGSVVQQIKSQVPKKA